MNTGRPAQAAWRARNILIKARPGIECLFIMYGSCPLPQVRMKSTQNHIFFSINEYPVLFNALSSQKLCGLFPDCTFFIAENKVGYTMYNT